MATKNATSQRVRGNDDTVIVTIEGELSGKISINESELNIRIKAFAKSSKELHDEMALLCASALCIAVKHGTVNPMNAIIEAAGDGMRRNTIRDWAEAMGPFRYDEDDKKLKLNKDKRMALASKLSDQGLAKFASPFVAKPWFKWKKEAEYKSFNFYAELNKLVAKARKLEAGDIKGYKADAIDLTGLDKIVPIAMALKPGKVTPPVQAGVIDGTDDNGVDGNDNDQNDGNPPVPAITEIPVPATGTLN